MFAVVFATPAVGAPRRAGGGGKSSVSDKSGVSPGLVLGGLSLLLRVVLNLQKLGVTRLVAVVNEHEEGLLEAVEVDPRVCLQLEPLVVGSLDEALQALPALAEGAPMLFTRHDLIVQPSVYQALVQQSLEGRTAVLAARDDLPLGPAYATAEALELLDGPGLSWARAVTLEGGAVAMCNIGSGWVVDVNSRAGRSEALFYLFEDCRKPVDGVVSRNFNRHISLFISRLLVNTPITPNMMTGVTFLFALAATLIAAQGGYAATLVGAILMQLNSILDGCDGELARVRFQGSKLGQWLDTVGDDLSNVLFWAALGFGALSVEPYGFWLAVCGWVAAGGNALAAICNYALLARQGSGDFYDLQTPQKPPETVGAKAVAFINVVLKQDFFLFLLLCLAIGGIIHHALPLMALGATVTFGNSAWRLVRQWRQPATERA